MQKRGRHGGTPPPQTIMPTDYEEALLLDNEKQGTKQTHADVVAVVSVLDLLLLALCRPLFIDSRIVY